MHSLACVCQCVRLWSFVCGHERGFYELFCEHGTMVIFVFRKQLLICFFLYIKKGEQLDLFFASLGSFCSFSCHLASRAILVTWSHCWPGVIVDPEPLLTRSHHWPGASNFLVQLRKVVAMCLEKARKINFKVECYSILSALRGRSCPLWNIELIKSLSILSKLIRVVED